MMFNVHLSKCLWLSIKEIQFDAKWLLNLAYIIYTVAVLVTVFASVLISTQCILSKQKTMLFLKQVKNVAFIQIHSLTFIKVGFFSYIHAAA